MIGKMGIVQDCMIVYCDSQSIIHLIDNQIYHVRTKHINIKLHFIRHIIEFGEVRIEKITSKKHSIDLFMKSLPRLRFKRCL